jgi:hypothetical protein
VNEISGYAPETRPTAAAHPEAAAVHKTRRDAAAVRIDDLPEVLPGGTQIGQC